MSEIKVEHPATKACASLSNNLEVIGSAITHNYGIIDFAQETEAVINRLNNAGLGYSEPDSLAFVLHSKVTSFVSHFEKKGRHSASSDEIHAQINKIDSAIEMYIYSSKDHLKESERYLKELTEYTQELATKLQENCLFFAGVVSERLTLISNLNLKLKEARTALEQHIQLREAVNRLDYKWVDRLSALDRDVARLVKRRLVPVINNCIQELLNSSRQINEQITALKKEQQTQRRNELVDSVHRYLVLQSIGLQLDLDNKPEVFNRVVEITMSGWANLNRESQREDLEGIKRKAAEKKTIPTVTNISPVKDTEIHEDELCLIEISPLQAAVEYFYEAVLDSEPLKKWDAEQCYGLLEPEVDYDFWLWSLVSYFHANERDFQHPIKIEMDQTQDKNFNGNYLVHNIIVYKVRNGA